MARTRTLAEIRDDARAHADQVNSTFVTDILANSWINQALGALWDILVLASPDRYYVNTTLNTTQGNKSYALPADFYNVRGVDLISGNDRIMVDPYEFQEKNLYRNYAPGNLLSDRAPARYRIMGQGIDGSATRIYFEPDPGTNAYEIHYIQTPQLLVADGDDFDGVAGWEDYIVYDVAARMARREESHELVASLVAERNGVKARIEHMARLRDSGRAPKIARVRRRRWHIPKMR